MRRFNTSNFNWKYIIGEVLLIFIGINLAIWFNNWNASNTKNENKKIAITKIEGEVRNNLEELIQSRANNIRTEEAITTYKKFKAADQNGMVSSTEQMRAFQKSYPGFFTISDSTSLKNNLVLYQGYTYINLELTELSEIAWETSKVTGIANVFGYECLYQLEGMYNVQRMVQKEMSKAAEALQDGQVNRLLRILEFVNQLDSQLESDYNTVLETMGECM